MITMPEKCDYYEITVKSVITASEVPVFSSFTILREFLTDL